LGLGAAAPPSAVDAAKAGDMNALRSLLSRPETVNEVAVDGSTVAFNGSATWNLNAGKDANATITISNSAGQEVYNGGYSLKAGNASFVWDGKGNDGTQWPPGNYTMSITAKDTTGAAVTVSTEIQGVVDSVDLTASPALLSMGGNNYTVDQIKRVIRATTASTS